MATTKKTHKTASAGKIQKSITPTPTATEAPTASQVQDDIPEKTDSQPLIVVGIGASAGGLEALQQLVAYLPKNSGLSYVLAQHLSPSYRSMMVELLEKTATIPIIEPINNEIIQPNTLYICPPNYNIEITKNNTISLSCASNLRHLPRPSVDMLFESIAFAKGEAAIGIILSGTGTDGSRGIGFIKGEGGFSIAQDPQTAKFDGMPKAAINSGNIDIILPPQDIAHELNNLVKYPRAKAKDGEKNISRELYNAILRKIKRLHKVDFSLYKENTIMRRIDRRMTALKIRKFEEYLDFLTRHDAEVEVLFNDMLIGVTSFLRDPRAFHLLQEELKNYISTKDNQLLRVWVAGCSTGEEAYTIAILISELLDKSLDKYKVQIFATDIDKAAIEVARNGIYPESALRNLPKQLKKKYFMVNGDNFEVIKPIKSLLIFSEHDLTQDPPFLRLDLISCRNLLIYFNIDLQRTVIPIFHYALNPKGLLFLGQSESIGVFQEKFITLSQAAKIYQAAFLGRKVPPARHLAKQTAVEPATVGVEASKESTKPRPKDALGELIVDALKQVLLPNSVLINENMDIVYSIGTNPLLIRPQGLSTNNIFKNLHPALNVDLRAAIHKLSTAQAPIFTTFQKISFEQDNKWARLVLMNIPAQPGVGKLILVLFQIEDMLNLPMASMEHDATLDSIAQEQERQLLKAKEQLQTVIEELEASNEEMQSMNEELQSSNEELQSANEELETTNEELQSTNEELQTAYSELRMAYDEKAVQEKRLQLLSEQVEQANSLLEDAERLGKVGSLLWHVPQNTLTWSKGVFSLFGLNDDSYKPTYKNFIKLAHNEDRNKLEDYLTNLVTGKNVTPLEFRAFTKTRKPLWLSLDAVVTFTEHKQAEKVLATLTDITERVKTAAKLTTHIKEAELLLNTTLNGVYIYDYKKGVNSYINPAYTKILGYSNKDINSMSSKAFMALFHPDDVPHVLKHLDEVKNSPVGKPLSVTYRFKHKVTNEYITLYSNDMLYEVDVVTGAPLSMLGSFFENTEVPQST